MIPLHQKHARHQTMGHEHADAREIIFAETPPQTLVEPADAIVRIGRALAVGDAVEEMSVVGTFFPHRRHFCRGGLKVTEILLAQAWLFVHFDGGAGERGRFGCGGGEGVDNSFGSFTCAAIRGGEEMEGVRRMQQGAQLDARFGCLEEYDVSFVSCEWRAADLNLTCFQPSGVSLTRWSGTVWWMSRFSISGVRFIRRSEERAGQSSLLPSDCACRIKMISCLLWSIPFLDLK